MNCSTSAFYRIGRKKSKKAKPFDRVDNVSFMIVVSLRRSNPTVYRFVRHSRRFDIRCWKSDPRRLFPADMPLSASIHWKTADLASRRGEKDRAGSSIWTAARFKMESHPSHGSPSRIPSGGLYQTAMSDHYYVRSKGKVRGPFSFEKLKTQARKGHVTKTDQISEDKQNWRPARQVEGLFPKSAKRSDPEAAAKTADPKRPRRDPGEELVPVTILDDEPMDVAEPESRTEWHYCLQGDEQTQGPVSEAKLKRLFRSGRLPYDTLVWNETFTDWVEAGRIPAFLPNAASPSAGGAYPSADPADSEMEAPVPPLASASLILAILGIAFPIGLGSVLAVVFGHVALSQIKAGRGVYQGESMAKTGLIIGYVTLAILLMAGSAWLIYQVAQN